MSGPMEHAAMRVLVLGASGNIGSHLVLHLLAAGCPQPAAGHNLEVLEARDWPDVELAHADVFDPASLERAFKAIVRRAERAHGRDERVGRGG